MKVLVACHCKKPIYDEEDDYFMSPELEVITNRFDDVELYYIDYDEGCPIEDEFQFKEWTSIPSDLKFDIVWMENCPIWNSAYLANNAKQILNGAHTVLNPSGTVIIGAMSPKDKTYIEQIAEKLYSETGKLFSVNIQNKNELPLILTPKDKPNYVIRPKEFIVLTKESAVGGYKRNHTQRRHRTKRQQTKRHNNKIRKH